MVSMQQIMVFILDVYIWQQRLKKNENVDVKCEQGLTDWRPRIRNSESASFWNSLMYRIALFLCSFFLSEIRDEEMNILNFEV